MPDMSGGAQQRPVQVAAPPAAQKPGFVEFVLIVALMMGLISLSIDNLLPAFAPIQADFGIADPNALQWVLTSYMIGFAAMQLVYGPLSDVVGRRPTMMAGLVVYIAGSLLALVADSFTLLLIARGVQGLGAAAARVLAVAIVRDRFAGREMARVMSMVIMVFLIVPVFAPAIGAFFLWLGGWHYIFLSMLGLALIVAVWFGLRMPETLHPEYRFPFSLTRIGQGVRLTATNRVAVGYASGMGLMMGCIMAYVGMAQPIFETEVYGLGPLFPLAFGLIAVVMGLASLTNARLVRRVGMRRMSHVGLCGFILASALQLGVAFLFDGRPPLLLFGVLLALSQFGFSLTMPNFNSMAMEPLGAVAGTASSFLGFYTTLLGALLGLGIGQFFDGTVIPLSAGYLGLGVTSLLIVLWTERGRLFHPQTH